MITLLAVMSLQGPLILPLIPAPLRVKEGERSFALPDKLEMTGAAACPAEANAVESVLKSVGVRIARVNRISQGKPGIRLELSRQRDPEGAYRLEIDSKDGIKLESGNRAGLFYAAQTLRQILMGRGRAPTSVPEVSISDEPRFEWRGMLLDVSRHFFKPSEIKKLLDDMAQLKLNVFQWHLTDDGGWRMEVKKYPQLTEKGAWRSDISDIVWSQDRLEFPGKDSGKKLEGGYYSQDEIREIVQYAADRHITIIPEIEIPGHALAAMESYPELGCDIEKAPGEAYKTNVYCAGKDSSFKFIHDVLDETMALFPSKIIHIGGDEVYKGYWSRCPRCKERMAAQGLKNYEELQSDFIKRIEGYLNAKGRTLIGWDEILEGGLAPNAWVMSWRGVEGGIAAAKSGHDVVMTPTSHCYFDYSYDTTPTEHVYGWEPVPAELSTQEGLLVKGGQANVWTEWIASLDRIEYMIYPRIFAMAEVLWSSKESRYWPNFQRRLDPHYGVLAKNGIDFYVGRPAFEANLIVFKDTCELAPAQPPIRGIDLRYALGGKQPTSGSPKLEGTLRIDRNETITAAYMSGGKILEGTTKVVCMKGAPKVPGVPGITYQMSKERFMKMPAWKDLNDLSTGSANSFDIAPFAAMETFALRWHGFIRIEKEGLYTFTLGSDDGSRLEIAGAVIVDNDGPHAFLERSGKAYLLPGDYPFEIGYFESGGAERFEAWVEGPGTAKKRFEDVVVR